MRGKAAKPRIPDPDPKYGSVLVAKFINNIMKDGKKDAARKGVYEAIEFLAKKTKQEGLTAFETALTNIMPKVEVRSRRVGGANYQVPVPVSERRQRALAMRWIIDAARGSRKSTTFGTTLGNILFDAFNKEGAAYKKREDTHKMADANKAFAHFSW